MPHNLPNLLTHGVLTGSRAFNAATEESDWDIVILHSNTPNLQDITFLISSTDFTSDELDVIYPYWDSSESVAGFDLSEHEDLGEDFIEYDKHTIWGPLEQIIKYEDDQSNILNLFVYDDKHSIILDKFKELNSLITFLHGNKLKNREYRIQSFIELTDKLGITSLQ